jgi:hypothetical protein
MVEESIEDVIKHLEGRVNTFVDMGAEKYEASRGQVMAVDANTFKYLCHAPLVEELPDKIPDNYKNGIKHWLPMGGPPLKGVSYEVLCNK